MDNNGLDIASKPLALVGTFAVLSALYFVGQLIYRLYVHPLHKIPGPWINAVSRIPYARHLMAGTTADNVLQLHKKYGEAVRISPNEVSFISGETAWQDIYGLRIGKHKGHLSTQKDRATYAPDIEHANIITSNDEDHARIRKTLSHAFSERALAQQESLVQGYVDLLVSRLKDVAARESGKPQDITKWYNWTTFDIIADLMFGEPFGSLQDLATHEHITLIFRSLDAYPFTYLTYYWPFVKYLRNLVVDPAAPEKRAAWHRWVGDKLQERIERVTQRADFMSEILKHNGEKGAELTPGELKTNSGTILVAGSETTATLLSGATYCLLKNPEVMQKLKDEVRGRWQNYSDITFEAVNTAPYLLAVLQEALRYFPPVPTGFNRRIGPGGQVISGYYVPGDTSVYVSSWAVGRSERNFKDADSFIPERWMGDPRYDSDKKQAMQPFSFGARNCLGKNLAYAEMRLILAKIIWSFDLELDPKSKNWIEECKVTLLWRKPELDVIVKEVKRASQ